MISIYPGIYLGSWFLDVVSLTWYICSAILIVVCMRKASRYQIITWKELAGWLILLTAVVIGTIVYF